MQTPAELMEWHLDALYLHDAQLRITAVNALEPMSLPQIHLVRTADGNAWRIRQDLPETLAADLIAICGDEPVGFDTPVPANRTVLLELLNAHAPVGSEWVGPAYAFVSVPPEVAPGVITITEQNAHLLLPELADWLPDVGVGVPLVASLLNGRAVAVCGSSRITAAAHEAGVETLPDHRRRGHASRAVARWARLVKKMGAVPLYSTTDDNVASKAVANHLGLLRYGMDWHVGASQ